MVDDMGRRGLLNGLIVIVAVAIALVLFLRPPVPATPTAPSPAEVAVRMRAAEQDQSQRYFQRMLITFGNSQSPFASDLGALGLNGRILQQMPIRDAYTAAHQKAVTISDTAMRRAFLLELFNETED